LINSPWKKKRTNYDALHYINFITILLQPCARQTAEVLKYLSEHPVLITSKQITHNHKTKCATYTNLVPVLSIFIFQHLSSENRASSNRSEGRSETKFNTNTLTVFCLYWLQNSPDFDVR